MNTTDLIQDAHLMLETIKMCKSPSVRAAAARQLADIAAQLQAAINEPDHPTLKESVEKFHADVNDEPKDDIHVIDLAMKYRTRDGQDVHNLWISNNADLNYPVSGILGINRNYWTVSGKFFNFDDNPHPLDLIPTGELA